MNAVAPVLTDSALNAAGMLESFFKDFYYELLTCKERALRTTCLDAELAPTEESESSTEAAPQKTTLGASPDAPSEEVPAQTANANPSPLRAMATPSIPVHAVRAAEAIQERLKKILTEQTNRVLPFLDQSDLLQVKEAQYAMVALADEVFLSLPWSGAHIWQKALLESQMFQSQSAGLQIFQRIDALLSQYDPARRSLATVYFQILALGFKGGLSGASDRAALKNYERRLYAFIHGKNPSVSAYILNRLAPSCYDSTLLAESQGHLPSFRFWKGLIVALVLGLLFVSYVVWYDTAADLYKELRSIFEQFPAFLEGD